MSDTNDTTTIDEKKQDNSTKIEGGNLVKFITTITLLFIMIIFYYGASGLILFACKVGQSNILPTNGNCFPYKEEKINIQPIDINIFTTFSDPPLSMKINFPYDKYNSTNKIIDLFRNYQNEPKSNFLVNYFISIMEGLILFNYSSINFILNILNQIPELLLVITGPILVSISSIILLIVDLFYIMYLWFANMGWLFKTNKNNTNEGPPQWHDVSIFNIFSFNYLISVCLLILFVVLFFFSLPLFNIIAFLSLYWCIFSSASYNGEMLGKKATALTVIQDLFKYYKVLIMSLYSFLVISTAFSTLGTVQGIYAFITILLIYYGFIAINIFKPVNKENLTPLVSYDQAIKTCNFVPKPKEKHGFLYKLIFGQSGGNIGKELKKINKNLSQI